MATNCQAIAATTGEQCENDAVNGEDFCGITSHHAGNATVPSYDGEDNANDSEQSQDASDIEVPFSTDAEWWDNHADDMLALMNREPRDGEPASSSAARAVIKKLTDGTGDHFRAMFGKCDTEGCDRGRNGFHTDYCGKSDHTADSSDEPSNDGESGEGTVTVEKDGVKVTGSPEEIKEVLNNL